MTFRASFMQAIRYDVKFKYPTTIVQDRYGGCYSGGQWLAFPLDPEAVTSVCSGYDSEDLSCSEFWAVARESGVPIGFGRTPDVALADLDAKREAWPSAGSTAPAS